MSLAAVLLLLSASGPAASEPPKPIVGDYTIDDFAITFPAPVGMTYCPAPIGVANNEQRTVMFLEPPRECRIVRRFPSLEFQPDVPTIVLQYHARYRGRPRPDCRRAGSMELLHRPRALCRNSMGGRIQLWAEATYSGPGRYELFLTLDTTPEREKQDLDTFRGFAKSVRTCTVSYVGVGGKSEHSGSGPACPPSAWS
jgi:hypothetical protein